MSSEPHAVKELIWKNIIFFAITTIVGVVGAPFYIMQFGFPPALIGLFIFYLVATGMSITVGYHRHFSHATFKTNPLVQFLLLFFGAAAFEQSALDWSTQHRDHHRYVDTDKDPYSIKKGFFYAHIGWLIFWKHKLNYDNVKDLQKSRLVMNQHKHFELWAIISGIIVPTLIGAAFGHLWGALIIAVCLRLTVVYHATFCINSVCHMFGKATYDIYATARDHWLIALITYGEGYHNFHHRFPSDYRNGVRWYQFDPSKWLIAFLYKVGLAWDLRTVSKFKIIEARLAGEKRLMNDALEQMSSKPNLQGALYGLKHHYEKIKRNLSDWEISARAYQEQIGQRVSGVSHEVVKLAAKKVEDAREKFKQSHRQWSELLKRSPSELQRSLLGVSFG